MKSESKPRKMREESRDGKRSRSVVDRSRSRRKARAQKYAQQGR